METELSRHRELLVHYGGNEALWSRLRFPGKKIVVKPSRRAVLPPEWSGTFPDPHSHAELP
jgi:hypothetical protein